MVLPRAEWEKKQQEGEEKLPLAQNGKNQSGQQKKDWDKEKVSWGEESKEGWWDAKDATRDDLLIRFVGQTASAVPLGMICGLLCRPNCFSSANLLP